jgi:O-antigen/teichoic acid export membrane protein
MAGLTTVVVAILVVLVVIAAPALTGYLFEGSSVVTVCLVLALVAAAPMHLLRGTCSGGGAFGSYAAIVALDGGVRVAACAALWLAGVDGPGPYALAVAASPLVAAAAVAGTRRPLLADGPPAALSDVAPNLGWLLLGQLFASALINAGPITVDLLGTGNNPAAVTRFGNAVIFARIPLFLFQAVQAALLPKLASLAAASDLGEFRDGLRRLVVVVSTIGAAGVVGALVVGPPVLELVYDTTVNGRTLMLLALSSALVMLALSIAQAVVALGGHSRVALGWVAGFSCYVLVAWLAADGLYLRVELALVASAATVLVVLAVSLQRMLAAR